MTDDDICGAECADGSPCNHPAGSCPHRSHSDPDAENLDGRSRAIDENDHEAILEAAREGLSKSGCARAAGASLKSLNRHLDDHPGFRAAFVRARNQGEQRLIREGLEGEVDTSMAKFLLSTSFEYVERREVEHDGDVGLGDVTVDFSD